MSDYIKSFYNSSDLYLSFLKERSAEDFRNIVEVINQYVIKGSKLLEFGCGTGSLASIVCKNGYDVTGVDISEQFIKYACDNYMMEEQKLTYQSVNFGQLPFSDNSFDCIFTCAVLEHCYDIDKILNDFNRLLKKGGVLVINTPNMISPFSRLSLIFSRLSGKRKRYHLYGSPLFLLRAIWINFKKAIVLKPKFIYVSPQYETISEGDEDVSFLSNHYDFISFLKPLNYTFLELSRGTSRAGKIVSRVFPRLSGEVLIVAKKL